MNFLSYPEKKIIKQMKGFKAIHSAEATLAGIELHPMLRKGQPIQAGNQSILNSSTENAVQNYSSAQALV
jgi:transposase-like protein